MSPSPIHPDDVILQFAGTDVVPDSDLASYAYDQEVIMVVRARVKPPRYRERRNGELTQVNVLGVLEASVVRSPELRRHLADTLGLSGYGTAQLPPSPLTVPDITQARPTDVLGGASVIAVDLTSEEEEDIEVLSAGRPVSDPVPATAFNEDSITAGAERVGRVGGNRDRALAAFFSEERRS